MRTVPNHRSLWNPAMFEAFLDCVDHARSLLYNAWQLIWLRWVLSLRCDNCPARVLPKVTVWQSVTVQTCSHYEDVTFISEASADRQGPFVRRTVNNSIDLLPNQDIFCRYCPIISCHALVKASRYPICVWKPAVAILLRKAFQAKKRPFFRKLRRKRRADRIDARAYIRVALCRPRLRAAETGNGHSMRIAQVAPLAEAVPPKLYGGTE